MDTFGVQTTILRNYTRVPLESGLHGGSPDSKLWTSEVPISGPPRTPKDDMFTWRVLLESLRVGVYMSISGPPRCRFYQNLIKIEHF